MEGVQLPIIQVQLGHMWATSTCIYINHIAPADVIALMRKCNKNLRIILISDDSSLETLRRIREDGIFYHALKPHSEEDNAELLNVVECAVECFHPA